MCRIMFPLPSSSWTLFRPTKNKKFTFDFLVHIGKMCTFTRSGFSSVLLLRRSSGRAYMCDETKPSKYAGINSFTTI